MYASRIRGVCQVISLISNLFKNAGAIRKVLRPIQDLAAAAAQLNQMEHMSPEELKILAGKLDQINAILRKYDLREDEQRVKFIQEAAELLSTLGSAVQREVYGTRVAEAAGISYDAMKLEVDKAYKRRRAYEKKKQEHIDLEPVRSLQPKSREIRYDNMKSAMAEEAVLAQILREPALLDQTGNLKPEEFSSPLLGKVYAQLRDRHSRGLEVSVGVLSDLTPEEMSHVAGISQRQQGPVNEQALKDCMTIIQREHQAAQVKTPADLMALREKLKERKGFKE